MPTLTSALSLKSNPFEHYIAETEPHIAQYAVKPPYLESIAARALATSSFILFGDRGAGKSATRITLFSELWQAADRADKSGGPAAPLAINFIDFTSAVSAFQKGKYDELVLVSEVAYLVVEQILAWLSSLPEDDRSTYTQALSKDEAELVVALLTTLYSTRAEFDRKQSESTALKLLNRAWTTRSSIWVNRKWDSLSGLVASIVDGLTNKYVAEKADVAAPVAALLQKASTTASGGRVILEKLVDFVRIFSFSGVVILIDKVDETEVTQRSAEATARMVYPLLSHMQLLEVEGLSWMLFLWSQVRPYMVDEKTKVRLDKIAHESISWGLPFFRQMLDARISYFLEGKLKFADLFEPSVNVEGVVGSIVSTAMSSPRELLRLLDVIVREHDVRNADNSTTVLLSKDSVEYGQDRYVQEKIFNVYDEKSTRQLIRVNQLRFTNKEVQTTFRLSAQSARNRIGGVGQCWHGQTDWNQGGRWRPRWTAII
ncbi:P-loop ATPase, Sll1717 family [Methylorubrum extorquens]